MTGRKNFTHQFDLFGVPPLKMVLGCTENDRKNAASLVIRKSKVNLPKAGIRQEDLIRLVEHLKKKI